MDVKGKKVLIISANKFEDTELEYPLNQLKAKGAKITIAGPSKEPFYGKGGRKVKPDIAFDDLSSNFDLLILPGGKAPEIIRKNEKVLEVVRQFNDTGKPIANLPWSSNSDFCRNCRGSRCYELFSSRQRIEECRSYLFR